MNIVVLLEIANDGDKYPCKGLNTLFPFSEVSSNRKAYLVIDELHWAIFLLLGRSITRIHCAIARRAANSVKSHGYHMKDQTIGIGFDIIEINEDDQLPPVFKDLLDQNLEDKIDYWEIKGATDTRDSSIEWEDKIPVEIEHETIQTIDVVSDPEDNQIGESYEVEYKPKKEIGVTETETPMEMAHEAILTPEDVKNLETMAEHLNKEIEKQLDSQVLETVNVETDHVSPAPIDKEPESLEIDSETVLSHGDMKAMAKYLGQGIMGQEENKSSENQKNRNEQIKSEKPIKKDTLPKYSQDNE